MFAKLVSNLPFSSQLINQISFYAQRLKHENATRRLVVVFAALTLVVQVISVIAPPQASNAASSNDVIYGGLGSKDPKGTLLAYYDANGDWAGHTNLQALFNHWSITRADLVNTHLDTITAGPSIYGEWYSMGRNPHSGDIATLGVAGGPIYLRPLAVWGRGVHYRVLQGKRASDGWNFAVMVDCGNLALFNVPGPPQKPPETPPSKPLPEKQVRNVSRPSGDPASVNANNTTAKAGETLEYTLAYSNSGKVVIPSVVIKDNLNDILEYADLVDKGGGSLSAGVISWAAADIPANQTLRKTFRVKIKDPVPATPRSTSDRSSFDLCMDNVFEGKPTRVCINIPPPAKVVEQTTAPLPNTGPGLDIAIGSIATAGVSFFFLRNRQLIKEIAVLRQQHNQGV